MGAGMKRHILVVLLTLTLLIAGIQAAFSQTDPAPARGNAAPLEMLPQDLQGVDIKDYYIAAAGRLVGFIRTVVGHVVVLHEDTGQAYFAAAGDAIFKHDLVFTLKDSRCRLKFTTDDIITMGDNARIGIEKYIDDRVQKKKTSVFSMLRGKAMFYALRLFKYRTTSTSIKTPTAILGVRGTKFGVEVREVSKKIAAGSPIYLAAASNYWLPVRSAINTPGQTLTVAYCFEGELEVYSQADGRVQTIGDGQMLETTAVGAGDIKRTPPEIARQFIADTEAPAPKDEQTGEGESDAKGAEDVDEDSKTAEDEEGEDEAESDGDDIDTTVAAATDSSAYSDSSDIEDVSQTLTAKNIESSRPTDHFGYFTGMLTQENSGSKTFLHLYLSQSLQNLDSSTAKAHDSLIPGGGDLIFDGSYTSDNAEIRVLEVQSDTITGFPYPIQVVELGFNQYLEWGYWTQTHPMTGSGVEEYLFDNRGYGVVGDFTPDSKMSSLIEDNFSGAYSGTAYGTYWTDTDGADMSGTFSAQINFGAAVPINNFEIHISGNGHSVDISGAEGQFTDSNHPSHFELTESSGTWQIDGVDAYTDGPNRKIAYGSVYGPNAEAMGGVWKIDTPTPGHATGIFQGTR